MIPHFKRDFAFGIRTVMKLYVDKKIDYDVFTESMRILCDDYRRNKQCLLEEN